MTTDDRLCELERQMREVRAALFLDDPNLAADLVSPVDAQIAAWGVAQREPVRETWVDSVVTWLHRVVMGDERKTR